jgi:hypothetical protein
MTARALLRNAEDNPDVGYFKRKALRLKRLGIRVIGPSARPAPPQPPTRAGRIRSQRYESQAEREHRATIAGEIAALDAHAKRIEKQLGARTPPALAVGPGAGAVDYRTQERHVELRQLAQLRRMLEDDLAAGPIRTDRDGREIDDRLRAYLKFRAREIAETAWASAERAESEGDYRRARQERRDALRARLIVEHELHWRSFLPGYSQPWN